MRRKEVIFVCVVAISTFLLAAADTEIENAEEAGHIVFEKEVIGSNEKREIPTTELPGKTTSEEDFDDDEVQEVTTTASPKKNFGPSCSPPPEIDGTIPPQSDLDEYRVGARVSYSCNYGYVSRNSRNHMSSCIVNETTGKTEWTVPKIACIPRSCADPGYVSNGRRIGNLFTFPNKVEFECEEGYKLVGMKTRYCQAGGEWSGRLPSCEPITCSIPPDIVNGEVTYPSLEYGSELTYRCHVGYMETHKERRYCDTDGTWNGEAPECIETRCSNPISPELGEVHFIGEPKVGSIATYSCNPGLKLQGASTTKCLITGQWTFGPPQCQSPCSVPLIRNGEMSKVSIHYITRWRKEETYTPLSEGERVDHEATLSFRCSEGFAMLEDDKIVGADRINVTCYDGKWSRNLLCEETSCLREPPETEYGKAVVRSRHHGYAIWYLCDDPSDEKIKGNVTCHFGTWIGIPPRCVSRTPCYSSDLKFPGLVRPSQNRVTSSQSVDIVCKQGYRLSTSATTITCKRGKWNVTEDPCPLATGDPEQGRPVIVPSSQLHVVENSSNTHKSDKQPPEECHCTYVGAGYHVLATVGKRKLKDGDKVKQGRKVTFSCQNRGMLTWQNGFRMHGKANMTCTTCQRWEIADNPACLAFEGGGPFIVLDDSIDMQPGGVIEVPIKKPITISCASSYRYPIWSMNGLLVRTDYYLNQNGGPVFYISRIYFNEIGYHDAGLYTCYIDLSNNFRLITVNLRVKEDSCPLLAANPFVTYSNGNKFGSRATFKCPEGTVLHGHPQIVCQNNGIWSAPEPNCAAIVCPYFPAAQDLKASYSDSNQVGSRATFSCPENAILVGTAFSDCRSDGTWSFARPYCLNKTTCTYFNKRVQGLNIEYSNGNSPGSRASFSCSSDQVLNGQSFAVCLENGTWSQETPSCEDKCSIEHLSTSVKNDVIIDMRAVTDEFVPFGSTVPLTCEEKFIPEGDSIAVCGTQGRWKIGKFECTSGCRLNIDPSSHLRVHPQKSSYRFGETVALSCPAGEKTTNDVERLMCVGQWSDAIPECIKNDAAA